MAIHWHPAELVRAGRYLLEWAVLATAVGVLAGSASALFLVSLDLATAAREGQPWLVYLLPAGGLALGLAYHHFGRGVEGGNNLLLEEIHRPGGGVPGKMAPLILLATVGTHLVGGSAGREGTAVQMGGSLAGWLGRRLRLGPARARLLLVAGISAGFGSVFGTPLAGMLFGLEVLAVGRLRYDGLIPGLIASLVGDWTCQAWGVRHAHYPAAPVPALGPGVLAVVLLAGLAFALAGVIFAELTHAVHKLFARVPWQPARPALGGVALLGLLWLVGTRDYLGLSLPLLEASFEPGGVPATAFAWKIAFTALTLGAGFKGGEVTPLFGIGATLGCTLGHLSGVSPGFLAALGFVAVFAGAANTPLACTVMGVELFGAGYGVPLALVCCTSYVWTGHRGIYASQVLATSKTDEPDHVAGTVREAQASRPILGQSLLERLFRRRDDHDPGVS